VSFKRSDAFPTIWRCRGQDASLRSQLPHLDSLVQTSTDQLATCWGERNRVDTISVSIRTFETLDEVTRGRVPDADAAIERSSSYISSVGRNGNSCDAILDAKLHDLLACLNIPQANRLVTAPRSNVAAVLGEVQRIDILFMTLESVSDGFIGNVPHLKRLAYWQGARDVHQTYSDQLVFSSGGQIATVWAKADTSDVQISLFIDSVVLELADFLARADIVYLSGSIAACRHILAILAETDTTHNTFVQKIVEKLDIQNSG
jgi:hypothetical protein